MTTTDTTSPPPVPADRLLLSLDDAAQHLAVSRRTLYRLLSAGHLRTVHVGSRRLVPADEVRRFAASGTGA